MGNCQVAGAATVVIQHPGGRVESLYWPTRVEEVMRSNPGHHVALITLCIAQERPSEVAGAGGGHFRFTRVRILKPKDMLLIGQVYRLIPSQEVTQALKARKLEKIKKAESESLKKPSQLSIAKSEAEQGVDVGQGEELVEEGKMVDQVDTQQKDPQKSTTNSSARPRHWRPSLQSISEGVS